MKVVGDTGNLADEPSITDTTGGNRDSNMDPGPGYTNGGQWLSAEHAVQTLTPSSGANGARFGERFGDGRDATGSPDEGHSSGLTPNSSSAAGSNRLQPGSHMQSGGSSFNASPIVQGQDSLGGINVSGPGTANAGLSTANGGGSHFYQDLQNTNGFGMQAGLGVQDPSRVGNFASMGGSWSDMQQNTGQSQPHQPPQMQTGEVGDGVFRALMDMGSLTGLELSANWQDPRNGNIG